MDPFSNRKYCSTTEDFREILPDNIRKQGMALPLSGASQRERDEGPAHSPTSVSHQSLSTYSTLYFNFGTMAKSKKTRVAAAGSPVPLRRSPRFAAAANAAAEKESADAAAVNANPAASNLPGPDPKGREPSQGPSHAAGLSGAPTRETPPADKRSDEDCGLVKVSSNISVSRRRDDLTLQNFGRLPSVS